ncbi:cytochrome P450 6a8-like [Haematobia irritans]|uniref:cytochrome P450 6a8-like n=1 Tax=Haematobia irritans TaxID=7368 RepID=UPI003F5033BC
MNFWLIVIWTLMSTILSYLKVKYSYWDLKGLKQLKPHFLVGNLGKLKSLDHSHFMQAIYDGFHRQAKVVGAYIFTKPIAVVMDLDVVKAILIKDFNKFSSRMVFHNEEDILNRNLFNLEASAWQPLRNKFTPAFSRENVEFMVPTVKRIADNYLNSIKGNLETTQVVEIHDLSRRFTIDVISEALFGIECHSLEDPKEELYQLGEKFFTRKNFNIKWHIFKQTYMSGQGFFGFKKYPQFIENFFHRVVHQGIERREEENIEKKDFIDILLKMKRSSSDITWRYNDVAPQLFTFFEAGFESSASSITNALYELARHTEKQEKLRKEILKILSRYDNEITYEALREMPYLDQVIQEILRLYTPFAYVQRMASEDFLVPGSDITLDKGTEVFIPVQAIHMDEEIYENPNEFRPERFSPSVEIKRHTQAFLGFGDGPRNCIGAHFALLQVKIGLVQLLSNFQFSHCEKTSKEIEFSKHSIIRTPAQGIYLKVQELKT